MKPQNRHSDLIFYSREHHHTLTLCLHVLRNPTSNHQQEIEAHRPDLLHHFQQEEIQFKPLWQKLPISFRQRFEQDHTVLRQLLTKPDYTNSDWNNCFASSLRDHIRFEERELFPAIERCVSTSEKSY
ncbi:MULTISPECIES: hypothetical protein [Neisseria]|uniref:hypothetical protein n=1 Tax=Neisseria TaxID=482 RepID=UPI00096AD7EC|nr:hypothetical protein [Neisseria arctica]UOO86322.1 hemerythrin domain-containing protein [Neisseria arctica]